MLLESSAVGRTSLATIFIITTAVLYGWTVATLVAALAMAAVELAQRREFIRVTYKLASGDPEPRRQPFRPPGAQS